MFGKEETTIYNYPNDGINVIYKPEFIKNTQADKFLRIFEKNLIYNKDEDSKVKIMGKYYPIQRKQVAFGDPGTYYKFAGNTVYAHSWNEDNGVCRVIKSIKKKVELLTKEEFNFVLINRYSDGNNNIGLHFDDKKDLNEKSSIVGVSFGAKRDIQFKAINIKPKTLLDLINLPLSHGSCVVMKYPTNENWKHAIPKRSGVKTPRISLTFRSIKLN
jgi:alkylated DNA repair dioxygenase AlkB